MREIKFRCWIKKEKRMDNVDFINFAAQFTGKWECKEPDDLFDVATKRGRLFNLEDVELMQYTGLKDKNGKEIYEEDIVSFILPRKFGIKQETYIGVIKYDAIVASYKIYTYKNFKDFIHNYVYDYFYITDDVYIKVIGNIFENPELLE